MDPVITTPQRAKTMNGYAKSFVKGLSTTSTRIIPYPPNLSSTAARIIDPAIGASTCALGNQRCTP